MAAGKLTISDQDAQALINYRGSIPGQSLTNSPDNSYPWENPPRFTNRREAEIFILEELTEKETFIALTDMIAEGITIEDIARTYLLSGYSRGLWTVDLLLLLAESTSFIIMALAEKVGLDYELYTGEADEPEDPERETEFVNKSSNIMKEKIKSLQSKGVENVNLDNKELKQAIEEVPVQSLLQRSEEE